jgi:signal transduction histidine kinase
MAFFEATRSPAVFFFDGVRFVKLPIRDQILWPLIGLLLVAVAANAIFSAWWMSNRNLRALDARQRQIIGVLEESSFPLVTNVLEKLRRLTGDELVVWDSVERRIVVGTLPIKELSGHEFHEESVAGQESEPRKQTIGGTTYLVRVGRIRGSPSQKLYVLTSDDSIRKTSRDVIWPPLAVGAVTILLSIPLTIFLASSWARRIHSLERHVETIAHGDFGLELPVAPIDDELTRLVQSINSMSRQLLAMREQLIQGERTRLVAQLTAGFAHQLRNGIAGAKLAIQLHESRCPQESDTSLNVARNQLSLVEEEVQGLLSLGKSDIRPPSQIDLVQIVKTVQGLVSLSCEHKGVELNVALAEKPFLVMGFSDGLRAACLNLTLNAIDAAGSGGHVWLNLQSDDLQTMLVVEDDGPGPPNELAASLFESFVTSKPEGIGLGLTVAATVARSHHGSLTWKRVHERTRFELTLPGTAASDEGQRQ